MVVVPMPRLRVDGLTDRAEHAKGAEVVTFDVMMAETTEQTDGSWGGVELRQLMFLDGLPVAGGSGVYGCRLEDGRGDAV